MVWPKPTRSIKKIDKPLSTLPLPVGSPQKFDYSHNYTIFDPVQLFPQDIWRVQIWPQHRQGWDLRKYILNPHSHSSFPPLGSPKNWTIHTITLFLTLSNFLDKTPGEFKFIHNIGKGEIYGNIISTPSHSSLPPLGSPKNVTIHTLYITIYTIFDPV